MSAATLAGLPLGSAIVLAALLWAAGRVAAAAVEGRTFARRADRVDELAQHVAAVADVAGDMFGALEDIGKDVTAIRDGVDQLGDPHGGAR